MRVNCSCSSRERQGAWNIHHYTGMSLGWEEIPTSFSFSWKTFFQSPLTATFWWPALRFHTSDLKDWHSKSVYSLSELLNCLNRSRVSFGKKKPTRKFTDLICCLLQEWEAMGVEQLRLGTVDLTGVPTLENLHKGVEFILRHRARGNSVYVHCKAGRSRSATMVAAYLIQVRSLC